MDWCCLSTDSTLNRRQRSLYSVLRAEGCLGVVCLPPCVGSPSYPTFCSAKLKHFPIKWKEGNANPNFLLLHKMRLNVQICRAGQSEDHKQKFRFLDWKFLLSPEPTQPWQGCKHSSALHLFSLQYETSGGVCFPCFAFLELNIRSISISAVPGCLQNSRFKFRR